MTPNQIISIAIMVLLILICLIFLVRKKLAGLLALSLKFAFIICILVITISVFFPKIYNPISEYMLESAGVKEQIQEIDGFIFNSVVVESQKSILDFKKKALDLFKIDVEEPEVQINEKYLEENFYPDLVNTLSSFLRILAIISCFVSLIFITYISYSTSAVQDIYRLNLENQKLKVRIKRLEQKLSS